VTSHALKSFWRCYDLLPRISRSLRIKISPCLRLTRGILLSALARKAQFILSRSVGATSHWLASETIIITGSGSEHTKNTTIFAFRCFKISVVRSPACHAEGRVVSQSAAGLPLPCNQLSTINPQPSPHYSVTSSSCVPSTSTLPSALRSRPSAMWSQYRFSPHALLSELRMKLDCLKQSSFWPVIRL
jgi:hypothetical protein